MVYDVVIIGADQRGISTLERIIALRPRTEADFSLRVHIVDPGLPGQGVHREDQAHHLITNTTIAQTTLFVDRSVDGAGPPRLGPSYAEWLWLSGYRYADGIIAMDGDVIPDDTYTPRALLGRYLHWCYRHFVERLPRDVSLKEHPVSATSIRRAADGRFVIGLDGDVELSADYVFVTTGHASGEPAPADLELRVRVEATKSKNEHLAFYPSAKDFAELDTVASGARVLVCGSGLTAADVLSMLTRGRGGGFERLGPRRLRYIPSGNEPNITLYSRQGLPAGAKGIDQKATGCNYVPKLFTLAYVDGKRREIGKLDWKRDLLPQLCAEMVECYLESLQKMRCRGDLSDLRQQAKRGVERILAPWFDADIQTPEDHRAFVYGHLADDVDAAFAGNRQDPLKDISEMLRDLNDVVRHAVDYAGLTPDSHRAFLSEWVSVNNRVAAGPPKERNMELLALMEAGVVSMFEPGPRVVFDEARACFVASVQAFGYRRVSEFDVLVRARVDTFDLDRSSQPFFTSGRENGLFSPFRNGAFSPGGISIDSRLNVLDGLDRPVGNIWAMGYPVEGAQYYTYVLPCPFSNSRSLRDAATAAGAMLSDAASKVERRLQA